MLRQLNLELVPNLLQHPIHNFEMRLFIQIKCKHCGKITRGLRTQLALDLTVNYYDQHYLDTLIEDYFGV